MSLPLVSIVTPVLNGAPYIEKALRSIQDQGYPNIEHVLWDGGSTDGTLDILESWSARHPGRIRWDTGPDDGPGDGWTKSFRLAEGQILGTLGADDMYEPGAIQTIVDCFQEHPSSSFVHGENYYIDVNDEVIGHHTVRPFRFKDFVNSAIDITTTSAFYRRQVLETIGWEVVGGNDFEMMLAITSKHEVLHVNVVLSRLRLCEGSALNPEELGARLALYRDTYSVSRRYGGSRWSGIAIRYFVTWSLNRIGLGNCLPVLRQLVRRNRRVRDTEWVSE
jgi:glycosyltransferase involved in cell wall biosynthesis